MISLNEKPNWQINKLVILGIIAAMAAVLVRAAWLGDDVYITFRVIDNFINGYGLVWNISERVQVFTHPLWALLLSAVIFLTRNFYYTSIFASIIISLAAVLIIGFKISKKLGLAVIALFILITSKAFIEYSASGLENPLTFLLLAVFLWKYISSKPSQKNLFVLSVVASLLMLNRMDTLLFCLPAIGHFYWQLPKRRGALIVLAGFSPMIAWFVFSLIYYGFLLPNTYYAKLHAGISGFALIKQGAYYFANSFRFDPVTTIAIFVSLILAFRSKEKKNYAIAIGILLYLIYILRIGGDFMSGRFFGAPLLASVILFSSMEFKLRLKTFVPAAIGIVAVGIIIPRSVVISGADFGKDRTDLSGGYGITDERRYYYQMTGLLSDKIDDGSPPFEWVAAGKKLAKNGPAVVNGTSIGFIGFYAGPEIHLIDGYGLTEPFLARLPTINTTGWRIGHFVRLPPRGYKKSIESSQNHIKDLNLGEYYSNLKVIVSGEIWNVNRFKQIWRFHIGSYEYLIRRSSLFRIVEVGLEEVSIPVKRGHKWNDSGTVIFGNYGMRIDLGENWYTENIEIAVDHNDVYSVQFFANDTKLAETLIEDARIAEEGMRIDTLIVPDSANETGFNFIEIHAVSGDGWNSVANIRPLSELESE